MLNKKVFVCNDFQVNTYILWDQTKECVIVDPGAYSQDEKDNLITFINDNELIPKFVILTHCHIDHLFGVNILNDTYNIPTVCDKKGLPFLENMQAYATAFNFTVDAINPPSVFVDHKDTIKFGDSELVVYSTPGHADGSICLHSIENKWLFVGDVLFAGSIGRTDLPSGNIDVLFKSIRENIYVLDEETVIFSGHGLSTSVKQEKYTNPFVRVEQND